MIAQRDEVMSEREEEQELGDTQPLDETWKR
jgi:hypothetical protein